MSFQTARPGDNGVVVVSVDTLVDRNWRAGENIINNQRGHEKTVKRIMKKSGKKRLTDRRNE